MILLNRQYPSKTKKINADKMQVEYRFVEIDKESEQIRTEVINQIVCKVIGRELRQVASEEQMSDKIFTNRE